MIPRWQRQSAALRESQHSDKSARMAQKQTPAIMQDDRGRLVLLQRLKRLDSRSGNQAENELPQPQPPVEFGFLNVNPDPCMDVT